MELRHLRYFLAIAEAQSFTVAAQRLGLSQPTLSHQIKRLEVFLGTALFDRAARMVTLTSAGRVFQPYCQRALREADGGVLAVSELEGLMRGTLRMGLFNAFSSSPLSAVLAEFASRYPRVNVIARLLPREEMERELLLGELDLAMSYISEGSKGIDADALFEEQLVLVVGAKHALAKARSVPMARLADLDLVLLTKEFGARQFVNRFLETANLRANIVLEMNAVEAILATVRNSSLVTVLSEGAAGDTKGLHIVRLMDPVPRRTAAILTARSAHRSAAAVKMIEMIRAAYART